MTLPCPKCGKNHWQENSTKDRVLCMGCGKTFELTEVNAWWKDTILAKRNMEYDKDA